MRAQDMLTLREYLLMGQLRGGPQRCFDDEPAIGLREKGYAAVDPRTNKLVITDEGRKVGRITRRAH